MKTPKISVVMPVYNAEKYLIPALESLINQTFKDIEIIIIDDGSTDNSLAILEKHSKIDPRIKIISRENRGLGATLTELVTLSKSEFIARMDADDICASDRLERQIDYMVAHPECVLIGGQIQFIVEGKKINALPMPSSHNEIREQLLNKRFPICHPAILFRKSVAEKAGLYKISGAGEDLDFFLRISELGKCANLSQVVLLYRVQTNSLSMRKTAELSIGYNYAVHCAIQRKKNLDELSFEEYKNSIWSNRSKILKLGDIMQQKSEYYYRRFLFLRSINKYLLSGIYLFLVIMLRPKTSIYRFLQIFSMTGLK